MEWKDRLRPKRRRMGKNIVRFDRYIFCSHKRPQQQQQQQHINIFAVNFMVQNCYYLPVILLWIYPFDGATDDNSSALCQPDSTRNMKAHTHNAVNFIFAHNWYAYNATEKRQQRNNNQNANAVEFVASVASYEILCADRRWHTSAGTDGKYFWKLGLFGIQFFFGFRNSIASGTSSLWRKPFIFIDSIKCRWVHKRLIKWPSTKEQKQNAIQISKHHLTTVPLNRRDCPFCWQCIDTKWSDNELCIKYGFMVVSGIGDGGGGVWSVRFGYAVSPCKYC